MNQPQPDTDDRELTDALQEFGFEAGDVMGWALREDVAVHIESDITPGDEHHTVEVYAVDDGLVDPSWRLGRASDSSHELAVRRALDQANVQPVEGGADA